MYSFNFGEVLRVAFGDLLETNLNNLKSALSVSEKLSHELK